jgi:hypothetical protein
MILARHAIKGTQFSREYQAVLNYAASQGWTVPPTLAGKIADDLLIREAKKIGLWNNCVAFYNHHTTGDQNYARINYKSPGTHNATLHNSPSFSSKAGFTGDGTSAYINYNFTEGLNGGSIYTLTNNKIVSWCGNETNGVSNNRALFGAYSASANGNTHLVFNFSTNNHLLRKDTLSTIAVPAFTTTQGCLILKRNGSSVQIVFNNSVLYSTTSTPDGLNQIVPILGLSRWISPALRDAYSTARLDYMIFTNDNMSDNDIYNMLVNHRARVSLLLN